MVPVASPPRSNNASRIGVLLVHGAGTAAHSDTLIDFGQAFLGWVGRWQQAQDKPPAYGEVALNFTPYDAGFDYPIPYAELHVPPGPDDLVPPTWVCAEAWWASSARPLPFNTMLGWSFRYLWSLLVHLILGVSHRMSRLWPSRRSVHDGNFGYRLVDVVTACAHIAGYVIIGATGYAVLLPIIVAAQIPYPPFQNFIVTGLLRVFLQYNASELRVYYEDEIQAANMRRRVADAVAWLTRPAAEGGGDCASVTVIAHSGGAWVAHGMLSDATYAWAHERVRKFITLGCGLNKIWELAPPTLERLYRPITGTIYWLAFWGSYDPVPAGWMTPPRVGRRSWRSFWHLEPDLRSWQCIYNPDPLVALRHHLQPRWDALPPLELAEPSAGPPPQPQPPLPPGAVEMYWPDSVRVINRMDALTDHGAYFDNDEEVLRRVAAEIQAEVYTESIFWEPSAAVLEDAIPSRRNRVGVLAAVRLVGLAGGVVAGYFLGDSVAAYLANIGPIASLLRAGREVDLFLNAAAGIIQIRSIHWRPVLGGGWKVLVALVLWLPSPWIWLVVFLLWIAGAAIASLLGLLPYEGFRAWWEGHDRAERQALLRRAFEYAIERSREHG